MNVLIFSNVKAWFQFNQFVYLKHILNQTQQNRIFSDLGVNKNLRGNNDKKMVIRR